MQTETTEISIKGCTYRVPSLQIGERQIIVTKGWTSIASVKDEPWLEGEAVDNPEEFIKSIRQCDLKADIFTFAQKIPNTVPKYTYPMEWDNVAALPANDFTHWWESLPKETRKNVRRAQKRGVVVREIPFCAELIKGIMNINDELPIRQGKPFWHYGKSYDIVNKDYATFLDRSVYIGAYYENILIGFIKMVYMGNIAGILQLLCMHRHYDKRPANALIAKAVEICSSKGLLFLVYGKYTYGKIKSSQLTIFKHRNGFEPVNIPRYSVPLSARGWLSIKTGLHRGWKSFLPGFVQEFAVRSRMKWYTMKNTDDNSQEID